MSNNVLLETLIDPLAPHAISWVPTGFGWQILGGLSLIGLSYFLIKMAIRYNRQAYRREALRNIDRLIDSINHDKNCKNIPHQFNQLLKKTALVAFPKHQIAALYGVDWLTFLNKSCNKVVFTQDTHVTWQENLYTRHHQDWHESDLHELGVLVKAWIKYHEESLNG